MNVYILIHTRSGAASSVAKRAARIEGVARVDTVQGPYDVIARVAGISLHDVVRGVLPQIQSLEGVTRTFTCPTASDEHIWGIGREPTQRLSVGA